jgi:hypothetical protein
MARRSQSPAASPRDENGAAVGESETFDQRLSNLEAAFREQLAEKDRTIARQAAEIAAAEDAASELAESRDRVAKLRAKATDAKEGAAAAKKAYESAQDRHLELEAELLSGQKWLPFPEEASDTTPTDGGPKAGGPGGSAEPSPTIEEDDSWRLVELSTLESLTSSVLAKLSAENLKTMGDLQDFLTIPYPISGFTKQLIDIPGIGNAAAEKIQLAIEGFWVEWAKQQHQELNDAVSEAVTATEAERGDFDPAWRKTPIEKLGLDEDFVLHLKGNGFDDASDLIEYICSNSVSPDAARSIEDFRRRLSNAQIHDFDRFRAGMASLDDSVDPDAGYPEEYEANPEKEEVNS